MIILLNTKMRARPWTRMLALAMVVGGLVAYRWDVNLSGQLVVLTYLNDGINTLFTSYTPAFIEILVGAGVVAFGLIAFTLGVQFLKVVDHSLDDHAAEQVAEPALATGD